MTPFAISFVHWDVCSAADQVSYELLVEMVSFFKKFGFNLIRVIPIFVDVAEPVNHEFKLSMNYKLSIGLYADFCKAMKPDIHEKICFSFFQLTKIVQRKK